MPLSLLDEVRNFWFNSLSLFLSIIRILSSQAISFQILLPWSILLPFPSYFNFHNFTYLGINDSTHDMTILPQTTLNYHILDLHNNTQPIMRNISRHSIKQSHPIHHPDHTTLHPMQPCLIHNNMFPRFTTLEQDWSSTTLINRTLLQRC